MPEVSVVIPTRNREHLLCRAIGSALVQSVQDFELLIVDDASDDGTAEAVRSFRDQRITYIRHAERRGVAAARNTGISSASAEHVALLDDDDEWLPWKLETQIGFMERADRTIGAVFTGYVEIDRSSDRVLSEQKPHGNAVTLESILSDGRLAPTSTILVRRRCFLELGLFDTAIRYGEDLDMWVRIVKGGYALGSVSTPCARIYVSGSGLTQDYDAMISGAEAFLDKHRDFYTNNPVAYSAQLHRLGTLCCLGGDRRKGRAALRRSMQADPLAVKTYITMALSSLGPSMLKAAYDAKSFALNIYRGQSRA